MNNDFTISMIACITKNRCIGKNNELLTKFPEDLQHFKQHTIGHPIIMGRNTYHSIGKPLPDRTNIVLTKNKRFKEDGIITVNSIDEALDFAKSHAKYKVIFIIGGEQIYKQFLKICDYIYLTEIDTEIDGDAYFPELLEHEFENLETSSWRSTDTFKYRFTDWKNIIKSFPS